MKIIVETKNYAVVKVAGGAEGHPDWDVALKAQLEVMESLGTGGFKPLHYLPRFSAWVCEKVVRAKAKAA